MTHTHVCNRSGMTTVIFTTASAARIAAIAAGVLLPSAGYAQESSKAGYTIFKPTPRELMRDLSADRPDATESAYTVDAGHFQIEVSLADFTYDKSGDVKARSVSVAPLLLKVGLCNSVDLHLGLDPYTRVRTEDGGTTETVDGFGDLVLRVKKNLWGNDEGDCAGALMPYIKIPTADDDLGNGDVEGGLMFPVSFALPHDFGMAAMVMVEALRNADDTTHVIDMGHSISVGREIAENLGAFLEYAGQVNLGGDEDYRAYINTGLTYALTADLLFDVSLRFGLTNAADDFGTAIGLTYRY